MNPRTRERVIVFIITNKKLIENSQTCWRLNQCFYTLSGSKIHPNYTFFTHKHPIGLRWMTHRWLAWR